MVAVSPHTCQRADSTMTIGGGWRTSTELYLAISMRKLDGPLTFLGRRHMAGYVKLRHFPTVIITGG
jgi:hypothetical protein